MPTARLIDINTAAIVYRTKVLVSLDKRMYRNCLGGIMSLNALLPPDDGDLTYRIIIDSDEYDKKVSASYVVICKSCDKEIEYDKVKILDSLQSNHTSLVTSNSLAKIWYCPKCNEKNNLSQSRLIEDVLQKPYYFRYVPEPPEYTTGLLSQIEFHNKFVDWIWNALTNIEEGFTRFRDDNWNRGGDFFDDQSVDTSLDEAQKE